MPFVRSGSMGRRANTRKRNYLFRKEQLACSKFAKRAGNGLWRLETENHLEAQSCQLGKSPVKPCLELTRAHALLKCI